MAGGMETVTTMAVLLEVADALAAPGMRVSCARFLEELMGKSGTVVHALDRGIVAKGVERYRQREDKAWSLTDCISFVVMEEEELTEALTGDRHFEQAGFTALLR